MAGCYVLLPHGWGLYTNLDKLIFFVILYYLDFLPQGIMPHLIYIIYVLGLNIIFW